MMVSSPISKDSTHNTCKLCSMGLRCSTELSERIPQKLVHRVTLAGLLIYLRTWPSSSQAQHRTRSCMCPCDALAHCFFSLSSETNKKIPCKRSHSFYMGKIRVDKFLSSFSKAMSTIIQQIPCALFSVMWPYFPGFLCASGSCLFYSI